jgi:hypothetical protein
LQTSEPRYVETSGDAALAAGAVEDD